VTTILVRYGVAECAYRRLIRLRDGLRRKASLTEFRDDVSEVVASGPEEKTFVRARTVDVLVNDVDAQILVLCERAIQLLEGGPKARGTSGLGKYVVLGGAAFDWLGYPSLLVRFGDIVPAMIRRGSPDPNLSCVVAPALQIAFEAARLGLAGTEDDAARAKIRAFGMGMVTAIAADTLVAPVARGASLATAKRRRDAAPWIDPTVQGRVDALVREHLLGNASQAELTAALPARADLPEALIDGLLGAVDAVTHAFSVGRPTGYPDFEQALHPAPRPTRQDLANTYAIARDGLEPWGMGAWWLYLLPYSLSLIAPVLIAALPDWKASRLFRKVEPGADGPDEESVSQLAILGQSMATLGPAFTTFYLRSRVSEPDGPFWAGVTAMAGDVIAAVLLATSVATGPWDPWIRWLVWIVPLVGRLVFGGFAIGESHPPLSRFYWIQTFPLFASLLQLLVGAMFYGIVDGARDTGDGWKRFGWTFAGFAAVVLGAQIIVAAVLDGRSFLGALAAGVTPRPAPPPAPPEDRLAGIPALVDVAALPAGNGSPVGPAAVFDESVLFVSGTPVDLAALRYPPGDRPLLRLWWTGAGTLQICPAGDRLRARIGDAGAEQVVVLPAAQLTPAALAAFLIAHVTGRPDGAADAEHALHAEPFVDVTDAIATHPLPYPAVIEDVGGGFVPVGGDQAHAYVLRNARRAQLVTPLGSDGPAVTAAEGWPVAPGPGPLGDEGTAVGLAGELAALLALGAASRLHPGPATYGRPPAGLTQGALPAPVSQVFRTWNLDERRANEWRTLVGGGAWREKGPDVGASANATVSRDPGQLPDAAADSVPMEAGTVDDADRLGWLPAFRAWSRLAVDIEEDTNADTAAPYTPIAAMSDRRRQPTNRELSEIVRYVLDLPR